MWGKAGEPPITLQSLERTPSRRVRTPLALLGSIIAFLAAGPVPAGQVSERDYADMASLAARSLLLDGVAVGERLVVVGERGHVLVSTDHGESWHQSEVPTRATLTAVYFHDPERGWAVGHDAVILRTRDGGASWKRVHHAPEEERPLLDVLFLDARQGFAIGAYGYFLQTTDGGDTWSQRTISADDFHLNHMAVASNGRLYIAAEAGRVYRSDDGARSWKSLPSPYSGSLFGTLPLEADTLLLFGMRGSLFRSADGGEHWESLATGTQALLTSALRLSSDAILVTGLQGTLLLSVDAGGSFELRPRPQRLDITGALSSGDGGLVLIGGFGVRKVARGETP